MATNERIIPARIADDGSVHYTSVTSAPDDSIAVCYMVPDRVIPVIFVPGVMGSNLKSSDGDPVWSVNSGVGVAKEWVLAGPKIRKEKLNPATTMVDDGGDIPTGTAQSEVELRRRGWGSVAKASYGTFLTFLENALNDVSECKSGLRAQLTRDLVADAPGVKVLSREEVALSYKYYMPVHAVGYNWLQSNTDSAKHLADKIREFTDYYKKQNKLCEKVIIVTHSMGGLVARYCSEVGGHRDSILGIVHGVMPTTGAATAYKRVKAGTEGIAGPVLGPNSASVTPVFAQSPGPLQLLPSVEYGMGWLKIRDGQNLTSLPVADPYAEIYLQRGKWWSLIDDKSMNPLDPEKKTIDADWEAYENMIIKKVRTFHRNICGKFHHTTYVFYGDDALHKTWGDVVWRRRLPPGGLFKTQLPPMEDLMNRRPLQNSGTGALAFGNVLNGWPTREELVLQEPIENGDGTVPVRSGRAPAGRSGVRACVAFPAIEHEAAYKNRPQQLFALWAITRIVTNVKGTSLEYLE
jgi:pimeloyl-ACP methyl ester carboxylesterase